MTVVLRNGLNNAKIKMGIEVISELSGHSGGIPLSPELMKYTPGPYDWKEYIYHKGSQWFFHSILVIGIIPGGKEEDNDRQAVFLTPLNPCGKDLEEEKPHSDYTVPQKAPCEIRGKRNHWVRLKEAQDQGLQIWQTKSFAIMTYFTEPGDCIDRVTA